MKLTLSLYVDRNDSVHREKFMMQEKRQFLEWSAWADTITWNLMYKWMIWSQILTQ